jgi:hypothetical protein
MVAGAMLIGISSAVAQQPPTTSPVITVPRGGDVVGGAVNSGDGISAGVVGVSGTGGGTTTPGANGSAGQSGSRPAGAGSTSSGSGTVTTTIPGYDPLFYVRRGDVLFAGEGCGAPLDPDGGNCVVDEGPASPPPTSAPAPGGPAAGAPRVPTRDELIAAARRPLPLPGVATSPRRDLDQLVNLPTWLWVDNWAPVVGTASSPALTVTVTARPRVVSWQMGDGSAALVCGAGTPWNATLREEQQRSDCTHTYRRSSANEPGQRFTATATMTWDVSWSASNGESGALGSAVRSESFQLRVAEGQAILTSSGG